MARSRRDTAFSFDVSHDAGRHDADPHGSAPDDGGHGPVSAGAPEQAAGRWRTRWHRADRRQRRTAVAVAAGAALVLAGGTVAAAKLADLAETERLRAAPGGVLSLDGPLTEVWRADATGVAAVLPGGGLVATQGTDLVAREVATGAERWRTALSEDPACGPAPRWDSTLEWTMTVEVLTSVHGPVGGRTVTVLDADGAVVGQRELDPQRYGGPDRSVAPSAHGGLLVAEHETELASRLTFATPDQMFSELSRMQPDPGPVRVHEEDALTGERRRTLDVARFAAEHGLDCYDQQVATVDSSGPGTAGVAVLNLGTPRGTPSMVTFHGCGTDGGSTYDGVDLGHATAGSVPLDLTRQPYPGDRFVIPVGTGTALVTDDGTEVLGVRGWRLSVPATDGVVADGHVATQSRRVVALAEDGTERWSAALDNPRVLVRTEDVVVAGGWDVLTGYDPADGTELWTLAPEAGPNRYVLSAVTDGGRMTGVLLETSAVDPAVLSLFTLDLRSGQEVAPRVVDVSARQVVAVDGHLVVPELAPGEALTGDADPQVVGLQVLAPGG